MELIDELFFDKKDPYTDITQEDGSIIRSFDPSSPNEDYVWHRDLEDREIKILSGTGWLFQFDNEIPFLLNSNDDLFVPKMIYHRLIPGIDTLVIQINKGD